VHELTYPDPLAGEQHFPLPLSASSVAYTNALLVKAGDGICYGLSGYSSKASAQFIQVHDLGAIPADGAVPVTILTVPATGNFSIDYGPRGRAFRAGIVVCNSSTAQTKTIGLADTWFDVQYV
jgi:hypothetical protein